MSDVRVDLGTTFDLTFQINVGADDNAGDDHGHWNNGRFLKQPEGEIADSIRTGAEVLPGNAGSLPLLGFGLAFDKAK